jgi:DNA-binding transcriptional LysR family regulator
MGHNNRAMDRLANIEAFVRAAELGSFTLAAARLSLSPSALSRRVAQLEEQVGVRLFHRTTRAVRLSDDGRAFFERAREALRELDEAQQALSRLRDVPAGLLRVEAPTILGRTVIVPTVARLAARHPDLQVDLTLRDAPGDLAADGIDVAVRLGAQPDSSLVARRVAWTRMRVCGSPGYLRRKGTPERVADLARHELLGFSHHGGAVRWRLSEGGEVHEIPPGRRFVLNSAEALIDLALAGAGLVWLCDFMLAGARQRGQLVEVLEDAATEELPIHAVSLPSRVVLPKSRAFATQLEAELRKSGCRTAL